MARLNSKNKFKTAYYNVIRLKNYTANLTVYSVKQTVTLLAKHQSGFRIAVNRALILILAPISAIFSSSFKSKANIASDKKIKSNEKYGLSSKAESNLQSFPKGTHEQSVSASASVSEKVSLSSRTLSSLISKADYNLVQVSTLLKLKFLSFFRGKANVEKTISLKNINESHGVNISSDLSLKKNTDGKSEMSLKATSSLQRNLKLEGSGVYGFITKCYDDSVYTGKMLSGVFRSFFTAFASSDSIKGLRGRAENRLKASIELGALKKIDLGRHFSSQKYSVAVVSSKILSGVSNLVQELYRSYNITLQNYSLNSRVKVNRLISPIMKL